MYAIKKSYKEKQKSIRGDFRSNKSDIMKKKEDSHKVLLMGRQSSGKTSMRSIIFANFMPGNTKQLTSTFDVDAENVNFLGLNLNLWDCGGQASFMNDYLERQVDRIFCKVAVMIYVFDLSRFKEENDTDLYVDMEFYRKCIEALVQNSPNAKVYCLLHKKDLVPLQERESKFIEHKELIERSSKIADVKYYMTSIWDETLFISWSTMIHALIPNIQKIEAGLTKLSSVLGASEVVLFEKNSFLIIAYHTCEEEDKGEKIEDDDDLDDDDEFDSDLEEEDGEVRQLSKFDKISTIAKRFKLTCFKSNTNFKKLIVRNGDFRVVLQKFTPHSYVMIVMKDKDEKCNRTVTNATIDLNVTMASKYFSKLFDRVKFNVKKFEEK